MSLSAFARRMRTRVLPNLRHLPKSTVRPCRACCKRTLFVSLSEGEEFTICVRCRANLRYELLAQTIRDSYPIIATLDVLELDPGSPIEPLLRTARSYTKSFYTAGVTPGTLRNGARCEDITRLTFADESLDLIVSSDVLEHVPDAEAAFRESARVLRIGGAHLFTVPPRLETQRRAIIEDGKTIHLCEPEYHSDPLNPLGILAYWDFGSDLPDVLQISNMKFTIVAGPEGHDQRTVWEAKKTQANLPMK